MTPASVPARADPAPQAPQGAPGAPPLAAAPPAIERWILHFDRRQEEVCAGAYASLLRALPPDAEITVALPGERDATFFRFAVPIPEALADRITYLHAGSSMSTWARDRYTIFERNGQRCLLLEPRSSVHPGWRADLSVAGELALVPGARLRRIATELAVEGGDLLVTADVAYIGVGTVRANAKHLHVSEIRVAEDFAAILGRRVVVVGSDPDQTPHEHLDMYLHACEDGSVLLGDPGMAADAWPLLRASDAQRARLDCYGTASAEEQRLAAVAYDEVAAQLGSLGVRVHRVPALHARYGDVVLTWTNAVTELRGGLARAYVPCYGLPALDDLARDAWRRLGFHVFDVECSEPVLEGGALRCLTNVVRRTTEEANRHARVADRPTPEQRAAS